MANRAVGRAEPRPGERWVLRHRLADGSATDAVGWVQQVSPELVVLTGVDGRSLPVERSAVLLARRAPAALGGPDPRRVPAEDLQRIALPGWIADSEPLGGQTPGGWTLRAGGGFTGRANSCLAVGDPGQPIEEAAAAVVGFAARHGIAPMAQVLVGSEPESALRELGWTTTYETTDVLVTRLADLLAGRDPDPATEVTETLDDRWRAAYRRSRPAQVGPGVVEQILDGQPPRAFAGRPGPDPAALVSIARGHLSGDWLGVAAVWTEPDHRRRGLATAALVALGHWAARRGARYAYLQVAVANETAHTAYEGLGFRVHHTYCYLEPPVTRGSAPGRPRQ